MRCEMVREIYDDLLLSGKANVEYPCVVGRLNYTQIEAHLRGRALDGPLHRWRGQ